MSKDNINIFNEAINFYYRKKSEVCNEEDMFKIFYETYKKSNSPIAAFWLGKCYQFGYGTKKNYAKANEFFIVATSKKSAKEISQIANYYLSYNYRLGLGVLNPKDHELNKVFANEHLLNAAKFGYDQAQYDVGIRALFGIDMNQDVNLGVHMLMLASNKNTEVISRQTESVYGFAKAQKLLSFCYQNGIGFDQPDPLKAKVYYASSQKKENQHSTCNINKFVYDIDAELEEFVATKKNIANVM